MWVITYHGQPATLETLCSVEPLGDYQLKHGDLSRDEFLAQSLMSGITKSSTIAIFITRFGGGWDKRIEGIEIARCGMVGIKK